MLYELRIYKAMPGRLAALNDRFANYTLPFFKKHGMDAVGFWTDEIGTSDQITYILSFEDMGDREAKWLSFQADPGWQQARAETEKDGPLVDRVRNTFMRLTPYSPEPRINTGLQELGVYEAVPGKLPALHDWLRDHVTRLLKRHGLEVIAFWTEEVGTTNQVVFMLGSPSLVDREKSWAAFRSDPDVREAELETLRNGPIVRRTRSTILRTTAYSPV